MCTLYKYEAILLTGLNRFLVTLFAGMTHSTDENSMRVLSFCYWYFWVRVADFLDTFFFLLHKKFSHITTLHYTHHALVVWSGWVWMTYGADGQTLLGLIVNSGIHVIMYSYYFLAALGPHMQPYLWWKRYITKAQISQFIFLMMHILIPLFYDCGYPRGMIYLAFAQGALGLSLFINFYIHSYIRKPQQAKNVTYDKVAISQEEQSSIREKAKNA